MKYKFIGNPEMYNLKVQLRTGEEYQGDTVLLDHKITLDTLIKSARKDVEENHKKFKEESEQFLNDWEAI